MTSRAAGITYSGNSHVAGTQERLKVAKWILLKQTRAVRSVERASDKGGCTIEYMRKKRKIWTKAI